MSEAEERARMLAAQAIELLNISVAIVRDLPASEQMMKTETVMTRAIDALESTGFGKFLDED